MEQEPGAGAAPPQPPPPPVSAWEEPKPAVIPGVAGHVYADVPNRIIALIIDGIILFIINLLIGIVLSGIFGPIYDVSINLQTGVAVETNYVSAAVQLAAGLVISAVYWIYTWTQMRGSPGMRVLGMQVGNYPDGKTLTQNQAIRRWVALGGPLPLAQFLNPIPGIGTIIGLATVVYFFYLLYSTAQSPTKQGFHDKYANSVVVKAARVA